jgi:hypothetical protein
VPQGGLDADDVGVGLAVDQAGVAVEGGAADAGRAPQGGLVGLIAQDPDREGERLEAGGAKVGLELGDAGLVAERRVAVGRVRGRVGGVDAPLAVDVVEPLGGGVVGLQVRISAGVARVLFELAALPSAARAVEITIQTHRTGES